MADGPDRARPAPERGRRARAGDRLARAGRPRRRARRRLRRLRLGRAARRPRARPARPRPSAATRRRPRSSSSSRARTESRIAAPTRASRARARRGRACPTSEQLAGEGAARSTRRCAGSAGSTGSSSSRSSRAVEQWRYRNKLEYSLRRARRRARPRLPPPRELVGGGRRRGLPARLGAPTTRPATRSATGRAARESPPYDGRDQSGRPSQPRRPGGAAHRPGPDPPRHLARPSFTRPPVDLHTVVEGPSGGTAGPTGVLGEEFLDGGARRPAASASPTPPSSRPTPRWRSGSARSRASAPG